MILDRKFKMLYAAAQKYIEFKIGKEALELKVGHYRCHTALCESLN
jgi:hypothetical protein